jgi:hypothetical protein
MEKIVFKGEAFKMEGIMLLSLQKFENHHLKNLVNIVDKCGIVMDANAIKFIHLNAHTCT